MLLFLSGIALLIIGYFTYGKFVERVIGIDDRETPAKTNFDGIDFLYLPHWKNMLIQLLNIAGVGPVIGVILGIKFGSITFLIIPLGNIIAGAVHDFLSGMMSLRHGGANLPALIRLTLGEVYYRFFSIFMTILLLLVVAVFINIPAGLINLMLPDKEIFWIAVAAIFIYYICATLFPVDKIIGRIYPFFGMLLMLGTFALFIALMLECFGNPSLLAESTEFKKQMNTAPVIPVLFVTIACGIISGFHATQSPIIARTMSSEHQGRQAFYGMMVIEGLIAMIWAAAGMAIYNLEPALMSAGATDVLKSITSHFLGGTMSALTIIGIVVLAVTSGDTAMRSLRLSLSEILNINQKPFKKRILLCLPLIIIVAALLWWSNLSAKSFANLWNYFAWGNQVLAASTLLAGVAWLHRQKKNTWIAAIPGAFMVFIIVSYILWVSPSKNGPVGFGLPLSISYIIAAVLSILSLLWAYSRRKRL
ncbi:MAG: carbon starvation CstA family protein [Victivallaceae bacterium]